MIGMMPHSINRPSLDEINHFRSAGHAAITWHSQTITSLASALEHLDACLVANAERNIDEHQSLVSAAMRLSELLDGSAVAK